MRISSHTSRSADAVTVTLAPSASHASRVQLAGESAPFNAEDPACAEDPVPQGSPDPPRKPFPPRYCPMRRTGMHPVITLPAGNTPEAADRQRGHEPARGNLRVSVHGNLTASGNRIKRTTSRPAGGSMLY
jgi:hypothetical protein